MAPGDAVLPHRLLHLFEPLDLGVEQQLGRVQRDAGGRGEGEQAVEEVKVLGASLLVLRHQAVEHREEERGEEAEVVLVAGRALGRDQDELLGCGLPDRLHAGEQHQVDDELVPALVLAEGLQAAWRQRDRQREHLERLPAQRDVLVVRLGGEGGPLEAPVQLVGGRVQVGQLAASRGGPRHADDGRHRGLVGQVGGADLEQLRGEPGRHAHDHRLLHRVRDLVQCLLQHDRLVVHVRRHRGGRVGLAGLGHHVHQRVTGHREEELAHAQQGHVGRLLGGQVSAGQEVVPGQHADHGRDALGAHERLLELERPLAEEAGAGHQHAVADLQVVERLAGRGGEEEGLPDLRRRPLAGVVLGALRAQLLHRERVGGDEAEEGAGPPLQRRVSHRAAEVGKLKQELAVVLLAGHDRAGEALLQFHVRPSEPATCGSGVEVVPRRAGRAVAARIGRADEVPAAAAASDLTQLPGQEALVLDARVGEHLPVLAGVDQVAVEVELQPHVGRADLVTLQDLPSERAQSLVGVRPNLDVVALLSAAAPGRARAAARPRCPRRLLLLAGEPDNEAELLAAGRAVQRDHGPLLHEVSITFYHVLLQDLNLRKSNVVNGNM